MNQSSFTISNRIIGPARPCYIIAELSANHHQDFNVALDSIQAMKEAGADAVKLQTYTPDTMTIDCDHDDFRIGKGTIWEGRKLYELYGEASTPWEWHPKLFALANELGMDCFSTPFDRTSVDFLESLNPPAYKIASFELIDLPLIEYVASKGRPMIMSTGMASLTEIWEAVEVVKSAGVSLALLKCTSAYPSPPESMNLRTISHMLTEFDVPIGLSDHTLGIAVPITAVAMGACIIEKHFTLSRQTPGPDSPFSLEPHEFNMMVDGIRTAEAAIGQVSFELTENENASKMFRRSLYVVADVAAGEAFTDANVRSIRPGFGLAPKYLPQILGKRARCDLLRGTRLTRELIDDQ